MVVPIASSCWLVASNVMPAEAGATTQAATKATAPILSSADLPNCDIPLFKAARIRVGRIAFIRWIIMKLASVRLRAGPRMKSRGSSRRMNLPIRFMVRTYYLAARSDHIELASDSQRFVLPLSIDSGATSPVNPGAFSHREIDSYLIWANTANVFPPKMHIPSDDFDLYSART